MRSFGRKLRCASFAPHSLNVSDLMGKVSKILLGIEALLVLYPTLLGLLLVVGSVAPFVFGNFTVEHLKNNRGQTTVSRNLEITGDRPRFPGISNNRG